MTPFQEKYSNVNEVVEFVPKRKAGNLKQARNEECSFLQRDDDLSIASSSLQSFSTASQVSSSGSGGSSRKASTEDDVTY